MSGYEEPNYTQAPNAFFDRLLPQIDSITELKVTLAIIRQTFGYHRDEDTLSLSRLETLTGLPRKSVVDGINRALKRGSIIRRKAGNSYAYHLKVVTTGNQQNGKGGYQGLPETVTTGNQQVVTTGNPQKKDRKKDKENSVRGASAPDTHAEDKEDCQQEKPVPLGKWFISQLMDKIALSKKRNTGILSPTNSELTTIGSMAKAAIERDGHEVSDCLTALDYLVAKAAGQIANEPAAWCSFRTALLNVDNGWKAGHGKSPSYSSTSQEGYWSKFDKQVPESTVRYMKEIGLA